MRALGAETLVDIKGAFEPRTSNRPPDSGPAHARDRFRCAQANWHRRVEQKKAAARSARYALCAAAARWMAAAAWAVGGGKRDLGDLHLLNPHRRSAAAFSSTPWIRGGRQLC